MGSNSLAFKTWLKEELVFFHQPLEAFRNRTIGIDAEDYLHSILQPGQQAPEPLLPAHGGNGFTIKKRVDEDLARFREAGIRPWFVFPGLDLPSRDRSTIFGESQKAAKALDAAWGIYDEGNGEGAVQSFGRACTYRNYHILRSLYFHLHRQGVKVHIALYTAAAHLTHLLKNNYVVGVQGSASCLLYGCDQIVLQFEWTKNRVEFTTEEKILSRLDLTRDQFICACLISGSSILAQIPELDRDEGKHKIIAATDMIKKFNGDVSAVIWSKGRPYPYEYTRAFYALRHPLIHHGDGTIEPKDWENNTDAPSSYTEYVGVQFPPELYFYVKSGLVGARLLNYRGKHELLETPPLDGGTSSSYQNLVSTKLTPMRTQTIGLLSCMLHRYFQNNDVTRVCWFDESNEMKLNTVGTSNYNSNADTWHVKPDQSPHLRRSGILGSGLVYAIFSLADDVEAKKTLTPRGPLVEGELPPLNEYEEVRANIVWRFLHDRGYINDNHTLTSWGRVLKASFDQALADEMMNTQEAKAEMEEILFLAVELIRLDVLGTQQMFQSPPYSGGLSRGNESDKVNAMLISRVACLGSVKHERIGYTGPLSRSLLAYHQMIAAVREALRDLVEAHAGYIFLVGAVNKITWKIDQWTHLAAMLPFENEPDLALGLVVKSYLDELSSAHPADVKAWFAHVHDLPANLNKAWKMWDAINAGVQAGDGSIVTSNIKTMFKNADSWLKEKLDHAKSLSDSHDDGTPNGTA